MFQPLRSSAVEATADRAQHVLRRSGLEVERVRIDPLDPVPGVCVVAVEA